MGRGLRGLGGRWGRGGSRDFFLGSLGCAGRGWVMGFVVYVGVSGGIHMSRRDETRIQA